MTRDQIEFIIDNKFNKWLSLDNFWNIQLTNDGHVYPAKNESQFYFDKNSEIIFVRYTFPYIADKKAESEFVQYEGLTNGWLRPLYGGVDDPTIGRYHEAFAFEAITSIS